MNTVHFKKVTDRLLFVGRWAGRQAGGQTDGLTETKDGQMGGQTDRYKRQTGRPKAISNPNHLI